MLKYEGIVREKILDYKFNEKAYLYKTFSKIILNNKKICSFLKSYDIIVPVPVSKKKLNIRGYNQTELIAREIAKSLKLEFSRGNLIKVKDTEAQSTLNKAKRQENIKNCFLVSSNEEFTGKNVILFDDIYTTGSTAMECSKVLRKCNAKSILVLTIAKD